MSEVVPHDTPVVRALRKYRSSTKCNRHNENKLKLYISMTYLSHDYVLILLFAIFTTFIQLPEFNMILRLLDFYPVMAEIYE